MISNNYLKSSTNEDDVGVQVEVEGLDQDNDDLDTYKIRLVQESWQKVLDIGLEQFGVDFFKKIFFAHPELLSYFPFSNDPDYLDSEAFLKHTMKVAKSIHSAVDLLEDLETLAPVLKKLGLKHKKLGIKKEYYPMVLSALIGTLSETLLDDFKPHVKKAWSLVGNLVAESMISDHYQMND